MNSHLEVLRRFHDDVVAGGDQKALESTGDLSGLRMFAREAIESGSPEIRALAISYGLLSAQYTEIITGIKTKRKAAQNRLYWGWLTDMQKTSVEAFKGHTKRDWHKLMKEWYLVPIFTRDDQGYAEMVEAISHTGGHQEKLMSGIIRLTSTTQATVKQFSEYLLDIERHCINCGIMLRTDDNLYKQAMHK